MASMSVPLLTSFSLSMAAWIGSLLGLGDLVAQLVQGLLGLVDDLVGGVAGVDLVLAGLILGGILLGLLDGLVDVFLATGWWKR